MEWYDYYNKGENSLLSNRNIPDTSFPVCKIINDRRKFTFFTNKLQLYRQLINEDRNERCYEEIIRGELPQKPYFDIDINISNITSDEEKDEKLRETSLLLQSLKETIISLNTQIKLTDIMIFSSNSETKLSYHVIIDRWYCKNSTDNKTFCNKVINSISTNLKQYIDKCVYKSLQNFRMYMCKKYGTERFKRMDQHSNWIIENDNEHTNFEIFSSSLITNTQNCELIQNIIEENPQRKITTHKLPDKQISTALLLISRMEDEDCFDVRNIEGSLIHLTRLKPSLCKKCSKNKNTNIIHERENPFVIIAKNGLITFHCGRGGKFVLGNANKIYK